MFTDTSPDFASFSWGEKSSSITVNTPKSEVSTIRSQKLKGSRRRIVRACMRCRLRKTKCDGGKPCTRCTEADDVCEYMKCSKKESKEYSQDYVDRLLEMNDKYKTAMRILYANRRLSIQPDNIVIPSTEGNDVPLVHDILDRLGMVGSEPGADARSESASTATENRKTHASTPTHAQTWSTPSASMPSPSSSFTPTFFDDALAPTFESPINTVMDHTFFPDSATMPLDAEMLSMPYEVYSSLAPATNFTDFPSSQDVDWCPLSVLDQVMNGGFEDQNNWAGSFLQPSY